MDRGTCADLAGNRRSSGGDRWSSSGDAYNVVSMRSITVVSMRSMASRVSATRYSYCALTIVQDICSQTTIISIFAMENWNEVGCKLYVDRGTCADLAGNRRSSSGDRRSSGGDAYNVVNMRSITVVNMHSMAPRVSATRYSYCASPIVKDICSQTKIISIFAMSGQSSV